ncbi:MAG: PilZ domain-containing protein [Acidobacteriia bacterium]|nr:PilZ domain-containing protein [Terriglobia bacterium]
MERREYARYFASFEIEIKELSSNFPARGATTDVSLGGCYVATIFPLAVGSQVRFTMQVAGENVKGRGTVQTCHPGVGMGIHFIDLPDRDKRWLEKYLRASVANQPGVALQPCLP